MKKYIINFLFILLIIILSIEVLLESNIVISSVKFSFNIWQNNIFPSLFPFLVIGNILINAGIPELLGKIFKNIVNKLFKINPNGTFIIFLSMLSGFPSSAKYITELLNNNKIDVDDATKLLMFTHFSNPLFILGSVTIFVNDKSLGLSILISHYIGNFFIGILFRNYKKKELNKFNSNLKNIKDINIGKVVASSIKDAINTLLLILGSITVFLIITSIINHIFEISGILKPIINGIFEMTQGLKYLESLNINSNIKALISVAILSFGGLSIHLQIITIISDTKIKYFPYFISRILHVIISTLIFYFWKVF